MGMTLSQLPRLNQDHHEVVMTKIMGLPFNYAPLRPESSRAASVTAVTRLAGHSYRRKW